MLRGVLHTTKELCHYYVTVVVVAMGGGVGVFNHI